MPPRKSGSIPTRIRSGSTARRSAPSRPKSCRWLSVTSCFELPACTRAIVINLRLLQISDSALPVGGYTHSGGLEAAIARRQVHDAQSLETWARDWLRHVLGPLE